MPAEPRRILFVALQAGRGGMESRFAALLPSLNKAGWHSRMLILGAPGPLSETLQARNVDVRCLGRSGHFALRAISRLAAIRKECRAFQPDVLHACDSIAGVYARPAAALARVPARFSSLNTNYLIAPKLAKWEQRLARWSDGVICNSAQGQRLLIDECGVPPHKALLVRQGIDIAALDRVNGRRTPLREQLDIGDAPLVGMIGKLTEDKDPLLFVRAAALLTTSHPRARFCLVASGPLEKEVRTAIEQAGVAGVFSLLPEQPDAFALAREFDIAVMTSKREGLPNTLLEYMWAAKPAVVTDAGECGGVVVDGETGFVVPRGSAEHMATAIGQLIDDAEQRARMGRAARSRLEREFSIERYVADLTQIYNRALGARGVN